ncbi:hypothetical protein [Candidatus Clostridium stratigraminis]|uniref:DUF4871 domain-containing protein n=1 Tax=Candidatus Clostridium stratigraminis TaxID=3381661 RepID=A0ABW8SYP5_9CLOT
MNSKVLTLAVFVCVITFLGGTFAYSYIGKKTIVSKSSETADKVNSSENKKQPSQLENNKELKHYFFIKENSMNAIKLIGIQGKFGLTEPRKQDNFVYTTLYLWGNDKDVLNKQLKIVALNSSGNHIEIPNLYKITKDGHGDVVEKNTLSTARENLNMRLPSDGLWNLNIYLDDVLLGNAVIDINDTGNNPTTPVPLQKSLGL